MKNISLGIGSMQVSEKYNTTPKRPNTTLEKRSSQPQSFWKRLTSPNYIASKPKKVGTSGAGK